MLDDFKPYATVWYEQHQLTEQELEALRRIVEYTLANEAEHYDEYVDNGGNPTDHIYNNAVLIQELLG